MTNLQMVQNLITNIQEGKFDQIRSMLTDDFEFRGFTPTPIRADQWIDLLASLRTAFPDMRYNFSIVNEEDNVVNVTSKWHGTHSDPFDLSFLDMGMIPASNKSFNLNTENSRFVIRDGKIASWIVDPIEGASLNAILDQLEVRTPA